MSPAVWLFPVNLVFLGGVLLTTGTLQLVLLGIQVALLVVQIIFLVHEVRL